MEEASFELNVVLYNTVIDGLCKDRLVTEALNLSSEMTSKGIHPNLVTYNSLIQGLCKSGEWKEATKLLNDMLQHKIRLDMWTFSILVDTLWQKGEASRSRRSLQCDGSKGHWVLRGIEPNVVAYSSLINGYCLQNKMEEAVKTFNMMLMNGCSPSVSVIC
ncbi:hypothetical protein CJ030_MR2G016382 [Morella rubra]|uniref:Pentatricopeptide repeat-containing protein n=1 Tax=Morella rubra TaxID=262757 RepID=A0A6A1WI14_9ROSI|nr:hypothetical protein CJ030_MR2G016382 [Morella rubra]